MMMRRFLFSLFVVVLLSGCETGYIYDFDGNLHEISYVDRNGHAFFEGDIYLGPTESIASSPEEAQPQALSVGIDGARYYWEHNTILYQFDSTVSEDDRQRFNSAMEHWRQFTDVSFVLRDASNENLYPDYVLFTTDEGCWSEVGRQGGEQKLSGGEGCSVGSIIHEIGHTFGLWHEHTRPDRDQFITIHPENILFGNEGNFKKHTLHDADLLGDYDYASIMHYGMYEYSKGEDLPTITPNDETAVIGQRDGLSPGDIAAIKKITDLNQ